MGNLSVRPSKLRNVGRNAAIAGIALMLLAAAGGGAASAKTVVHHKHPSGPPLFELQTMVVDANTGKVLEASDPDALHHPASLTKMMTLYLMFDAIDSGRVKLTDQIPMSRHAASVEPTKLGVPAGQSFSVEDGILAIVTRSANDVATAFGEYLGGDELSFASQMTAKARALGMQHTFFHNASGLPDPAQESTPRDLVVLAEALMRDHAKEYHYFSTRSFVFNGQTIYGHNHFMENYPGADGLKTGFVSASGFNLVGSAVHDGHRLIGVVMGAPTAGVRDRLLANLFDAGFGQVDGGALVANANEPAAHEPSAAQAVPVPVSVKAQMAAAPVHHAIVKVSAGGKTLKVKVVSAVASHHAVSAHHAIVHQAAAIEEPASGEWGVQLGAYGGRARASQVAEQARGHIGLLANVSRVSVVPVRTSQGTVYRARLAGLSRKQAQQACHTLSGHSACAVVSTVSERVASRE